MRNQGIEFPAKGEAALYDLGAPGPPGPGEVLIATAWSGVTNGTERHALLGEHGWGHYPGRHGYQHVGRIEAVGEGVADFAVGDWIYYGRYVGHRGWHLQAVGPADVHSYDSHLCVRLPHDADRQDCALLGVAGVAMRGVRRFRVAPGQRVWVAGLGLIGQFAAQAARAVGAQVTVTDTNEMRLGVAARLGAHAALPAADTAALQAGGPYDCIIDACGAPDLFMQVHRLGLLAPKGVVGALAVRSETTFHWSTFHGREASIEVSCHYSLDDLRMLLHLIKQGIIAIPPLVTHRLPVSEAPSVYRLLRDEPGQLLGVIFDWSD